MGVKAACAAVLLAAAGVHSALPPGYDDELYCPDGYCQSKKEVMAGFVGPKSAYWQCTKEDDTNEGDAVKTPTPWGSMLGAQVKDALLAKGMSTKLCPTDGNSTSADIKAALIKHAQRAQGSTDTNELDDVTASKDTDEDRRRRRL
mmetsp:Transcript_49597/g.132704  ORF Transcript_49597/g.132704 Transcript_49597/m.132704 type:complete len:146 (-) Transcript_49597:87-524(-)